MPGTDVGGDGADGGVKQVLVFWSLVSGSGLQVLVCKSFGDVLTRPEVCVMSLPPSHYWSGVSFGSKQTSSDTFQAVSILVFSTYFFQFFLFVICTEDNQRLFTLVCAGLRAPELHVGRSKVGTQLTGRERETSREICTGGRGWPVSLTCCCSLMSSLSSPSPPPSWELSREKVKMKENL